MRTVVPKNKNEVFFETFRVNAYIFLWNRLYILRWTFLKDNVKQKLCVQKYYLTTYLIYLSMLSAGVDTTLINHSPGKHNPINNKGNLSKCVVYIFDEFNRTLGFGASVPDAEIVVHMKYVKCSQICMVRFQYSGQSGMALVMGIHKSVALLKVSSIKK